MRMLGAGAAILVAFMLANVVAAGVISVLGPLAGEVPVYLQAPAAIAVGAASLGCALVFLNGCIRLSIQPLFFGHPDPHKGLKSYATARGRGRSP